MNKKTIITAVQKKKELPFTPTQLEILDSMSKMKSCDVIFSITKTKKGPHKMLMHSNSDGFIRSLFKNK